MNKDNFNRLVMFKQIKKEIRNSNEYLIVGIDIAKDRHVAFMGNTRGKTLFKSLSISNTSEGFNKLIVNLESVKTRNKLNKVILGLEPTADYHKPLAEYLLNKKYQIVLLSNNATKKNRELLDGRWDKNDSKDSANIADLISQGKFLFYNYPSEDLKELKTMMSLKRKLKKYEHSFIMRIRNHLVAQYFPELDRHFKSGKAECLQIVQLCLSPNKIKEMELQQFIKKVTIRNKSLAQQKRLKTIWESAINSIGCETTTSAEYEGQILVSKYKEIRDSVSQTEKKIETICINIPEYKYLRSIPGFGPIISSMLINAIGDPHRFKSSSQVLKLAGYDLSASRSGKNSEFIIPRISKRGNGELRYALYQGAQIASSKNVHFISYFTQLLKGREKEKGVKTKMKVKLASKMLVIAWTLMKNKIMFDPSYLNIKNNMEEKN